MNEDGIVRANGLVHSLSSDTRTVIQIDPQKARLRKLRCSTITSARLLQQQLSSGGQRTFAVMVTLTYEPTVSWSSLHVSAFLKSIREWFRRQGRKFYYVWTAELTKQGMVHFHVIVWMPKGLHLPKPDKRGWWPYGMTRVEAARNAVGYIAKYCSKGGDTVRFPKGLRTHGSGGLDSTSRIEKRWWSSPRWVREWCTSIIDVRRMTGGGFVCVSTGEWKPSPWAVFFERGKVILVAKGCEYLLQRYANPPLAVA